MATDLVTRILDDHEVIRSRFETLLKVSSSERGPLFRELVATLVQHEAVESIVLRPMVREHVPDGDRVADARLEEEQEAEERLAELERMDPSSDIFAAALTALQTDVVDHAEAEERDELPLLREHLDAGLLVKLASTYDLVKSVAPTHPHPKSGQGPLTNLFAGPVLGMLDRTRDAVRAALGDDPLARS